jgi:hypothetical protein
MKAAMADIEANQMKWNMNMPAPPAAPWHQVFLQQAKEKYNVTLVYNWPIGDHDFGYNQVIRTEVEHRIKEQLREWEGLPSKLGQLEAEIKNNHLKPSEQNQPVTK